MYGRSTRLVSQYGQADFKGECSGMNGHVFQVCGERKKRGQFQDTVERLRVYAATQFTNHSKMLNPLFTNLKEPQVKKPKKPKARKIVGRVQR